MKTKILIIVVLSLCSVKLWAVPAYPYPIEITQPNGKNLTIIQNGDESFSWIETIDGLSIVRNTDGIFEYAILSSDGNIIPSGVKVTQISERTTIETEFISSISKSEIKAKYSVLRNKTIQKSDSDVSSTVLSSVIGTRKVLCILIGFTDHAFSKTQSEFNNLMNQTGYNANSAVGSVKDYYLEHGLLWH